VSVFKACDIRGSYPSELDEAFYADLGGAIGTLLRERTPRPSVLVGGDVRLSTPTLRAALIQALAATGCRVADLGIVPTPVVYFAARRRHPDGLAIVTASHNPPDHNGLKLCLGPRPITLAEMERVEQTARAGLFTSGRGSVEPVDITDTYVDGLCADAQPGRGLKLVLDCGNGTSSDLAPRVLRQLGYDVVELFCTPDGTFPNRSPNPSVPENLAALRHAVVDTGAALGLALDGDGDRLAIVDDTGRSLTGDQAIVLLAQHTLGRHGDGEQVVCDIKCSRSVLEAIEARGATPRLERSGHAFIKARMIDDDALFGGELSGHFFYRQLDGGDDALYSALRVAELAQRGEPISQIVDEMPRYAITPDIRVPYPAGDGPQRLDEIAAAADGDLVRLDGVRIAYPDGWGLARVSVTEPLLTFRFEAYHGTPRDIAQRLLAPVPDLQSLVLERIDMMEAAR